MSPAARRDARRALASVALAGGLLDPARAGAEPMAVARVAGDLGARLRDALSTPTAPARLLPTRFGFAGDVVHVALPEAAPAGCTVVALVGARGLGFVARLAPERDPSEPPPAPRREAVGEGPAASAVEAAEGADGDGDGDGDAEPAGALRGPPAPTDRATSSSGVALLRRCGGPAPRRLDVRFESGRGALEVVLVGEGVDAAAALAAALPDRAPRHPEPPTLGSGIPSTPLRERRLAAVERASLDGYSALRVERFVADESGRAELTLPLPAGCHRIDVLDADGAPRDVDGELRAESDERTLARDGSEARDARLEACLGEDDLGRLRIGGARAGARLEVLASSLPPLATTALTANGAAELARLARQRALPALDPRAVFHARVGAGLTQVGFEGRPGRCYAAVATSFLGRPRSIGLRVVGPTSDAVDERGGDAPIVLTPVCFEGPGRAQARLELAVRGAGVAADVAIFEVGPPKDGAR